MAITMSHNIESCQMISLIELLKSITVNKVIPLAFDMLLYPTCVTFNQGPFNKYKLTINPAWIYNYMIYKVHYEITYPFPSFDGATDDVWDWVSNSSQTFYRM